MKNKLIFFAVFVFLLSVSFNTAYADIDKFQLFIEPITDRITTDQFARFNLTLANNMNQDDDFNIDVDYSQWAVESQPFSATKTKYGWSISAGASDSIIILLKPASDTAYGTYKVRMTITSRNTGVVALKDAVVTVRPVGLPYGEYLPTITASVDLTNNGLLDPRSTATVFINLDNYVPIKMDNLTVEVRSKVINKNIITSLEPLERKTEQFIVTLDPLEKPIQDTLSVEVFQGKESLKKVKKDYEVIPYSNLEKDESIKKAFLRTVSVTNYTNNGNVNRVESVKAPTTYLGRFFTSASPDADFVKENGIYYFVWDLNVPPQQSVEISTVESFRGIALLALAAILIVIIYFVFRSPIVVQKGAKIMHRGETGISELKILLYIRNRTMKPIHQIKVLDKIPHIADLHEEVVIGTLKPSKILKDSKKGTLVEWEIPTLEAYEERIISYKITSKLNILGFFNLPSVLVKYKRDDKSKSVRSNRIKAALK